MQIRDELGRFTGVEIGDEVVLTYGYEVYIVYEISPSKRYLFLENKDGNVEIYDVKLVRKALIKVGDLVQIAIPDDMFNSPLFTYNGYVGVVVEADAFGRKRLHTNTEADDVWWLDSFLWRAINFKYDEVPNTVDVINKKK